MATPRVWSERVESPGVRGWHDCAYSSALMVLVGAGKSDYPLGIYTPAERNELEKYDTRPDNTGATNADVLMAVHRRYGIELKRQELTTQSLTAELLRRKGRIYSIAGSFRFLPLGHKLRRHQPDFVGGHQVAFKPDGTGWGLWLDPLAENKYVGDVVDVETVAKFAWENWPALYLNEDELAAMPDTSTPEADMRTEITITVFPVLKELRIPPGKIVNLYDPNHIGGRVKYIPALPNGSRAACDATVQIVRDPKAIPHGTFRRIKGGGYDGLLAQKDTVELVDVDSPDVRSAALAVAQAAVDKAAEY